MGMDISPVPCCIGVPPVTSGLSCLLEATILEIHKLDVILPRAAREPRAAEQRGAAVSPGVQPSPRGAVLA